MNLGHPTSSSGTGSATGTLPGARARGPHPLPALASYPRVTWPPSIWGVFSLALVCWKVEGL